MFDVYFYEAFREEEEMLRQHLPAGINAGFSWKTIQEQGDREPPARLVSIRTQSRLPESWGDRLAGILTRSTGYDHLKKFLLDTGSEVRCGFLPLYCNRAVAEQAMLLWMALMRKLPLQMRQFADFNRDGLTGNECGKKTLVVVGVGNIGSEVVKIGMGLGMRVFGVDIVRKFPFVDYADIGEALPQADVVVCAMNLTPDNRDYFDYRRFMETKRSLIFVNVARGEMSPAGDLLRLLQDNRLAGVALDVFNDESTLGVALRSGAAPEHPEIQATLRLAKLPNVILTPHNAFNTRESVLRKARQSMEQVQNFMEKGEFLWPVP